MNHPLKALLVFLFGAQLTAALSAQTVDAGKKGFAGLCAGCHGADGTGGERGPDIMSSWHGRRRSQQDLRDFIRKGNPEAGMPAFSLSDQQLDQVAAFVYVLIAPAAESPAPGDMAAGEAFFFGRGKCSQCHMVNGRGKLSGPDLSNLAQQRTKAQIEQSLRNPDARPTPGYEIVTALLRNGRTIRGFVRNESNYDLQLQDLDGHMRLLRSEEIVEVAREGKSLMPPVPGGESEVQNLMAYLSRLAASSSAPPTGEWPPSSGPTFADLIQPKLGDWPTYNGRLSGNRHSELTQIDPGNVGHLAVQWVFPIAGPKLEVTPVLVDGIMYVTTVNEAWALDAGTGRPIWHYGRPRTEGVIGDASVGKNRGVAVLGDRIFMVTDNAHLIALHRWNGQLIWDVEIADYKQGYGATSAPLVVKDLVITGTSGGDEGTRGFVAAYKASTGERVWRFWVVPAPGEPLSETWAGKALDHGCGTSWLTGTYDPQTNLLFWTTGNPCPDYNGDERRGDNLYSSSVVALNPDTGKLQWYYQYTPHDLHDWDATQTTVVVDAMFEGRRRQLLLQGNRNGFFYVLDRTNGKLLLVKPFVQQLTWATGIGADGKPIVVPGSDPTPEGVKVCPPPEGATNWMSTAFNPATGLFYLQALEKCSNYTKSSARWEPGQSFYGGGTSDIPGQPGKKYLRAIDVQTGKIAWEYPQVGHADSWGGVLSTASRLLFVCEDSGAFTAMDAKTGKPLWHLHTNQVWKASPMTYLANGKQYVAVAAGNNILAFGLP